jgi:hypothetical protein
LTAIVQWTTASTTSLEWRSSPPCPGRSCPLDPNETKKTKKRK